MPTRYSSSSWVRLIATYSLCRLVASPQQAQPQQAHGCGPAPDGDGAPSGGLFSCFIADLSIPAAFSKIYDSHRSAYKLFRPLRGQFECYPFIPAAGGLAATGATATGARLRTGVRRRRSTVRWAVFLFHSRPPPTDNSRVATEPTDTQVEERAKSRAFHSLRPYRW